jgi:hypothetical protein
VRQLSQPEHQLPSTKVSPPPDTKPHQLQARKGCKRGG